MTTDSGSPPKSKGPQKITLPSRSSSGKSTPQKPENRKPAWLLPVGLILFLGLGFLAIFLFKPGNDEPKQNESVSVEDLRAEEIKPGVADSNTPRTFTLLAPEELDALKEQATQAVAAQANVERPHRFQDILFGKAASLLTNGNTAMGQNAFQDAQIAYEDALGTVDSLVESYQVADQISELKSYIQALDSTLKEKAASLLESENYRMIHADLVQADELLKEGRFQEALEQLKQSETSLEALTKEGEQQFENALREGLKALNSGDGDTAKTQLTIAQDLRPNDPFIAQQLKRAEVIDQVFEHFNQGLQFEQQGLFGSARVEYQKALELDPDSVNINTRLQNINQTLNKDLFEEALEAGLAALTAGNGDAAVEQLQKATSLMPADAKARSALEDARELQRRQKVDRLLNQGERALAEIDWEAAQTAFHEVLRLEPSSQKAQNGLATAEEQIAREEQLKQFLLEAETFERNGEFEKALIVLREGRQVADPSGVISEKIEFLEGILEEQSSPQKVKILSDNQTDIQIYKVGKFKPAQELELELRPGEYTIIGSRLMYRDVRYTLVVEVGETPQPIQVICREKL